MNCRNCGNQLPEGAKFCNRCGAQQDLQPTNPPQRPYQQPAQQPYQQNYQPPVQPQQTYQQPQQPYQQPAQSYQQPVQPQQRPPQQTYQQPVQPSQPPRPVTPEDEKAFRAYLTPYLARNATLAMCALAVVFFFVFPDAGILWAAAAVFCAIPWLTGISRTGRRIDALRADGSYQAAVAEFAASTPALDGKVRYSENFIFGKGCCGVLRYTDVGWLYRHTVNYLYIIPVVSKAMAGDSRGNVAAFCSLKMGGEAGAAELTELARLVRAKNPQVLLGFTAECEREYKRRTGR